MKLSECHLGHDDFKLVTNDILNSYQERNFGLKSGVSIQKENEASSSKWTERAHHDSSWQKKQRGSETKTYILTKAVGMTYADNGTLFTTLLGGA